MSSYVIFSAFKFDFAGLALIISLNASSNLSSASSAIRSAVFMNRANSALSSASGLFLLPIIRLRFQAGKEDGVSLRSERVA